MATGLKGKKGLSKEERQNLFCTQSRLCSGKAKDQKEAEYLCSLPKEPKVAKASSSSRKCTIDIPALASCIIASLDGTEISQATLMPIISGCTGQKVETPSREKFIKKCFRENAVTGDIKEAQKLRSMCTAKWKEKESSSGVLHSSSSHIEDVRNVAQGSKPAALVGSAGAEEARRLGLNVIPVPEGTFKILKDKLSHIVSDQPEQADKISDIFQRYPLSAGPRPPEYHVELGRALGYSEADIRKFRQTFLREG